MITVAEVRARRASNRPAELRQNRQHAAGSPRAKDRGGNRSCPVLAEAKASQGAGEAQGERTAPLNGRWHGFDVVCIASGPSATADDVETVRIWRHAADSRRVVVVNTTYQIAPWADVLFAMDHKWWTHPDHRLPVRDFGGDKFSCSMSAAGVVKMQPPFQHFGNSGAAAISLAYVFGARRILLLGYDAQRTGGRVHHHGDHPKGLGNAGSMNKWPAQFQRCAAYVGVPVINCSRATALTCFPRGDLETELERQ